MKQINKNNLPTVVLIGRANVGKSTLFNKFIEKKQAIVSDIAGTTRTNNEGVLSWRGKQINIIDTGGFENDENEKFTKEIIAQAARALDIAHIIVMVVDGKQSLLPQERNLAREIQKKYKDKEILLIANKIDSRRDFNNIDADYIKLGLGEPFKVSAASGNGLGDFLDILYTKMNKLKSRPKKNRDIQKGLNVSFIGKPNVGKSSLFNKIIGEEKVIVSDIAHTTREPHDTTVTYEMDGKKHLMTFIDTAGIRRKAKVHGILEREGIAKSLKTIEESEIILLVLDGSEPISSQDMQLGGLIERRSKSVVILINKWDLAEDNSDSHRNEVKQMVYSHFPHLDFAPILFVSGKSGYKTSQIFPLLIKIQEARKTEIPEKVLEKFIERVAKQHKPSRGKGTRQPKIIGFKQINTNPPIFKMFIKYRTSLHRSYINFVENRLREEFNFLGTPIVIKLSKVKK